MVVFVGFKYLRNNLESVQKFIKRPDIRDMKGTAYNLQSCNHLGHLG